MNKRGPIVVIEDDADDREMIVEIFKDLGYPNKIMCFDNGADTLIFLKQIDVFPFLILSDINMPVMDGLMLRNEVLNDNDLRNKCIPYLFYSTSSNEKVIADAYALSIQGFFVKPETYRDLKTALKTIVEYWQQCVAPR